MKNKQKTWMLSILGGVIIFGVSQLKAQTGSRGSPVSIAGKLATVKGDQVTIETKTGLVAVNLSDKTIVRGEVSIKFSDITAGMYVGATATKQPDGTFRASRLHVFSEDQRGTGEGHRPLRSAPQSGLTMTNASDEAVEEVAVQEVKGRMVTLKYKGGEIKVLVPVDTVVVKRVVGDRASLKPGAEVSVNANRADDNSLSASQVTVRATER
jgi:hypothetical protein